MSEEVAIKIKSNPSHYLKNDLINNAIQLNGHLAVELSSLQELEKSRIPNRLIKLAEATAIISEIALTQVSDIDTVIQNTMSE